MLEALACGTPVVTAAYGGARELVDDVCGAWGRPVPDDLADAVLALAARPEAVARPAARARAELFAWDRTVHDMLAVHAGLTPAARDGRDDEPGAAARTA